MRNEKLSKSKKVEGYNKEASLYDERRTEHFGGRFWYILKPEIVVNELKKRIKSRNRGEILDMCCGTGRFTIPIAREFDSVVSADLSDGMLAQLRDRLGKERITNVHVRKEDVENLKFNDDSFDGIVCIRALLHVPEYGRAIGEMIRVLKPGGMLIFSVSTKGIRYRIGQFIHPSRETTNRFTIRQVEDIISKNRGKVAKRIGIFWLVTTRTSRYPSFLLRPFMVLERFFDWIMPSRYASEVIFVVTK